MMTDSKDKLRSDLEAEISELEIPELKFDETMSYSFRDLILYKMDRTIAISGLVAIGLWSLFIKSADFNQATSAVITALGVYLGVKVGKK